MLRGAMRAVAEVFEHLLDDTRPGHREADAVRRREARTAVQKVINLALHYPRTRLSAPARQLATLNQPGSDVLRRVRDSRGARQRMRPRSGKSAWRPRLPSISTHRREAPLGIDDEGAAFKELEESLQHLRRDADKDANVQRIRAHRPGAGPE